MELLKTDSFYWKKIYLLPHLVTLDSYYSSFQCKILNNILYLDKKLLRFENLLHRFGLYVCKLSDEAVFHILYECDIIKILWNGLALFFENDFTLFDLTPQAAFLGFLNFYSKLLLLQSHLLLIFIYNIYIYIYIYIYIIYIYTILGDMKILN